MIVVAYTHYPFRDLWSDVFIRDRTFTTRIQWWDPARALWWLFELLWGAMIGLVASLIAGQRSSLRWAAVCGLVVSVNEFSLSRDYFFTDRVGSRVWAYGTYFMPLIGATLAALASNWLMRKFPEKDRARSSP